MCWDLVVVCFGLSYTQFMARVFRPNFQFKKTTTPKTDANKCTHARTPLLERRVDAAVEHGYQEDDGQGVEEVQGGDGDAGLPQGEVHHAGLVLHGRGHLGVARLMVGDRWRVSYNDTWEIERQ